MVGKSFTVEESMELAISTKSEASVKSINVEFKQGLGNDSSKLRANGRTVRALASLHCASEEQAKQLTQVFDGTSRDPQAWASLNFILFYQGGDTVEMKMHGRHPDEVNVIEPTGNQKTAVVVNTPGFNLHSRGERPKKKRPFDSKLLSGVYLDVKLSEVNSRVVECEVKFSTNITSRQHDRRYFYWEVTCSCALSDGAGYSESEVSTRSNDFEYVARQLGESTSGRSGSKRVKKTLGYKAPKNISDSDPDIDFDNEAYTLPPAKHSTRKRTISCMIKEMDTGADEYFEVNEPLRERERAREREREEREREQEQEREQDREQKSPAYSLNKTNGENEVQQQLQQQQFQQQQQREREEVLNVLVRRLGKSMSPLQNVNTPSASDSANGTPGCGSLMVVHGELPVQVPSFTSIEEEPGRAYSPNGIAGGRKLEHFWETFFGVVKA